MDFRVNKHKNNRKVMEMEQEEFQRSTEEFLREIYRLFPKYADYPQVIASGLAATSANLVMSQEDPVQSTKDFISMMMEYVKQIGLKKLKLDEKTDDEESAT